MTSVLAVIFAVWLALIVLLAVQLVRLGNRRRGDPEFVGEVLADVPIPALEEDVPDCSCDEPGLLVVMAALANLVVAWDRGAGQGLDAAFDRARQALDTVGERMPR